MRKILSIRYIQSGIGQVIQILFWSTTQRL